MDTIRLKTILVEQAGRAGGGHGKYHGPRKGYSQIHRTQKRDKTDVSLRRAYGAQPEMTGQGYKETIAWKIANAKDERQKVYYKEVLKRLSKQNPAHKTKKAEEGVVNSYERVYTILTEAMTPQQRKRFEAGQKIFGKLKKFTPGGGRVPLPAQEQSPAERRHRGRGKGRKTRG
jgi:hypothetical protein